MRIVLLGPPGSGKAELSQKISDHYGMPIVTVTSVMRRAAAEQTELGRLAKEAMEMSRVSDELLLALLRIQLPQMDLRRGFVLVDLPKNAGQADVLDSVLNDLDAGVELVLNLEVDRDELMERLVGRITCDNCGAQYNLYVNPPLVDGVCDACGARVIRRPPDSEETISNRLRVYEGQMGPLLQYYRLDDKLRAIEADEGPGKAWKAARKLIDTMPPSIAPGSVLPEPAIEGAGDAVSGAAAKVSPKRLERSSGASKAAGGKLARKVAAEKAPRTNKTAAKGTAAKKVAAKKPATAKAQPKKASTGKIAAKKRPAAAKAPAGKVAAKKTAAKKVAAKTPAAGKLAARKRPAKKATTVKPVVAKGSGANKRSTTKKPPAKQLVAAKAVGKSSAKKSAAKRVAASKVIAKKAVVKKALAKRLAAKKTSAGKAVAKKTAAKKKPASRKPSAKKSATKAAAKVSATNKATAKKAAGGKPKAKKR